MAAIADEFAPVTVSTRDLPAKERLPFWREALGRNVAELDLEPLGDGPLACRATSLRLPGLLIFSGYNTPYKSARTREMVAADTKDDLILVTSPAPFIVRGRGREETAAAGAAVLVTSSDQGAIDFYAPSHILSLRMPKTVLAPLLSNFDDVLLTPISRDYEPIRLLLGYVDLLLQAGRLTSPETARLAADHLQDLAAAALGATRDASEIANGRGLRVARLRAIKADVAENLSGDVSPAALAVRHGMSARYVHKLFENEGTTLSRYVLGQRLARMHRLLTDPRHASRSISDLAYRVGFGDLSTFNREFRRHFGLTPSDVRAAARESRTEPGGR
jgi:AraC-like DNA-binding protein